MRQTDPSARRGNWSRYLLAGPVVGTLLSAVLLSGCKGHSSASSARPSTAGSRAPITQQSNTQEGGASPDSSSPVPQVTVSDPTISRMSLSQIRAIEKRPAHDAKSAIQSVAAKAIDLYWSGKVSKEVTISILPNTDSEDVVDLNFSAEDAPTDYSWGSNSFHGHNEVTVTLSKNLNPLTVTAISILAEAEADMPSSAADPLEALPHPTYQLSTLPLSPAGIELIGGGDSETNGVWSSWSIDSEADSALGFTVLTTPADYAAVTEQAIRVMDLTVANSAINSTVFPLSR